jgi:hypothetical protein
MAADGRAIRLWGGRQVVLGLLLVVVCLLGVLGGLLTNDLGLVLIFLVSALLLGGLCAMNFVSLKSDVLVERRWWNGKRVVRIPRDQIESTGLVTDSSWFLPLRQISIQLRSGQQRELLSQSYVGERTAHKRADVIQTWARQGRPEQREQGSR